MLTLRLNCLKKTETLETLVEACKKAGLRVRRNKTKAMSQNNWFDLECETEKENLKSLGEQISQEPNNSQLRHLLQDKKKKFKTAMQTEKMRVRQ